MTRCIWLAVLALGFCLPAFFARADHPVPSVYPKSWELKFDHGTPKRIAVRIAGYDTPQAFWYMTYTITNKTDRAQLFLPVIEMLCNDGKILRSDKDIPNGVLEAIRNKEGIKEIESVTQLAGEVRIGEDQAREGVAIWPEHLAEMGSFSIFVGGLSGEEAVIKNSKGEILHLHKTLQLNYFIRGDDVYPGQDEVNENAEVWIMR